MHALAALLLGKEEKILLGHLGHAVWVGETTHAYAVLAERRWDLWGKQQYGYERPRIRKQFWQKAVKEETYYKIWAQIRR